MYMRDSIVFYRSFYEAIKNLPPEDFKNSVVSIMEYGLNDMLPESNGIEKTVFLLVKPQIDANNKRYQNGMKGGKTTAKQTEEEPKPNQSLTKVEPRLNQTITKPEPNVNVNVNDNDIKKKDPKGSKEKAHFVPPTLENVIGYCREKGYKVDAERFIDFYESKGWMVGKNKMKDWKVAVRNWARQDKSTGVSNVPVVKTKFHNFEQRDYDFAELEKQLINR